MAASVTVIGRTTRVRGRVAGDGDLQIEGVVLGEVTTSGNVTIDAHGIVGANVRGRRLVVRGAVQGDLFADEAVVLEEGARVVGDVRAPRIAIAEGALMRGEVQTSDEAPAAHVPSRAQAATRPAPAAVRAAPPPPPKAVAVPAPVPRPAPPVKPAVVEAAAPPAPRRAPPPIVPVLKKAKGQILKKKER
jgi:cytoskeletal protein CcmA (bactofilin family)